MPMPADDADDDIFTAADVESMLALPEDNVAEDVDDADEDTVTFADLGLPTRLLDAVTDMGFVTPTPIQAQAIPPLLEGRDVVGIAQTGTGKTAAFGLPLLATVDADLKEVQALVLAPTRELAMQSAQAITDFADRSRGLDVVPVYGGSPYGPQIHALKRGAQVVVGTPGRVIDLIEKDVLNLSNVVMLVLDEADEMLRMGFAEDVDTITAFVPEERLTALFSATMPPQIEKIANTHLTDPVRVAVSEESSTVDTIHQTYAVVPPKFKSDALARVLATRAAHKASEDADAAIVFVRTRLDVEDVSLDMASRGFRAAGISGDVAQAERERLVERLRAGTLDVLVATDVAARGLDVERIGLVVNYDVPREDEAYVHRIGRTGRAGREGRSLTFFTPREYSRLRRIEKLTGTEMEEVSIPTPDGVFEFKATRILDGVAARIEEGHLDLYHTLLQQLRDVEGLDMSDVAAALLAQMAGDLGPAARAAAAPKVGRIRREEEVDEFGQFISATFEAGRDRGILKGGKDGSRRRGGGRGSEAPFGTRYRVEVGRKDGARPAAIVGAIAGEAGISGKDIGHIELYPTFSLVDIAADLNDHQLARLAKAHVAGRALRIRVDDGPRGGSMRAKRSDVRVERGDERAHRRSTRDFERGDRRGRDERAHGADRHRHDGERADRGDRRDARDSYHADRRADRHADRRAGRHDTRGDRRFASARNHRKGRH